MHKWLLIIILFSFYACKKTDIKSESYEIISMKEEGNLIKTYFKNDNEGYIVGGITFDKSTILKTLDGGKTWHRMNIVNNENKIIYNIDEYNNKLYASGLDGKTYINYSQSPNDWFIYQNIYWERIYDFHYFNATEGLAISGQNWYNGRLYKIDSLGNVLQRDTFEFELNDFLKVNNDNLLISGYGAILHSSSNGNTWQHTNASGDHFISMYNISNTIWAIGKYGTILKSTDNGKNWNKIRNGSNPLYKRYLFNSIKFIDSNKGIIVGDKGLIWTSSDGGSNWKKLEKITDNNLNDIAFSGKHVIIIGDNGTIIRLKSDFFN